MRDQKIVIVGSGGVGKSAITFQFLQGVFVDTYDPTIEDSYRKIVHFDGQCYMIEILDTAGGDQFTAMRDLYMRNGHGFILVYSITSLQTFTEIQTRREQIVRIKGTETVPMILVGNKCDLEHQRVITHREGALLARQFGCPFMETSAKIKINVIEIFHDIVKQINEKAPESQPRRNTNKQCAIL